MNKSEFKQRATENEVKNIQTSRELGNQTIKIWNTHDYTFHYAQAKWKTVYRRGKTKSYWKLTGMKITFSAIE